MNDGQYSSVSDLVNRLGIDNASETVLTKIRETDEYYVKVRLFDLRKVLKKIGSMFSAVVFSVPYIQIEPKKGMLYFRATAGQYYCSFCIEILNNDKLFEEDYIVEYDKLKAIVSMLEDPEIDLIGKEGVLSIKALNGFVELDNLSVNKNEFKRPHVGNTIKHEVVSTEFVDLLRNAYGLMALQSSEDNIGVSIRKGCILSAGMSVIGYCKTEFDKELELSRPTVKFLKSVLDIDFRINKSNTQYEFANDVMDVIVPIADVENTSIVEPTMNEFRSECSFKMEAHNLRVVKLLRLLLGAHGVAYIKAKGKRVVLEAEQPSRRKLEFDLSGYYEGTREFSVAMDIKMLDDLYSLSSTVEDIYHFAIDNNNCMWVGLNNKIELLFGQYYDGEL